MIKETAVRLWHTAPYWRLSLIGAGVFSLTSLIYVWSGDGPGSVAPAYRAPPVPSPPPDPISDARLAAYQKAIEAASKVTEPGRHCEVVLDVWRDLMPSDAARGRDLRISSRPLIAAIAEGTRCKDDIPRSDQHFAAVEQTVNAAGNRNAKAIIAAIAAYDALDGFDRSRSRFATDPAVTQTKSFVDLIEASKARIKALSDAAQAAAKDNSAESLVKLAAAANALTDLDRARLSPEQQEWLASGTKAAQQIQESRGRLVRLALLMRQTQNMDAPTQEHFVEAAATITSLDQGLATPDEKQMISQAQTTARNMVWNLLKQRLAALDQDKQPRNYFAVAQMYQLIKDVPAASLTEAQRASQARAGDAANTLTDSDTRLKQLDAAAKSWEQQGASSGAQVLEVLGLITPLDKARFQEPQRQAWATLSAAEAIVRGPDLGLKADTKKRMPVFVEAQGDAPVTGQVVRDLRDKLRAAGFVIVDRRGDSAIVIDVSVASVDEPKQDSIGGFLNWVSNARLNVSATWSVDGSSLFAEQVAGTGNAQNHEVVKARALVSAVGNIVNHFQALAQR